MKDAPTVYIRLVVSPASVLTCYIPLSVTANPPEAMPPVSDGEDLLVQRLRNRDEAAMTIFYDRYSAALYGVIMRVVKKEEEAEDVLQESMVKIWNSFASYDASKGRLFTWVMNVSRNLAIDKIRSRQYRVGTRTQPLEDSAAVREAAPPTFRPEHIGLQDMTKKLSPDQQQVVDMLYFGGYTQSEVAEELNLPLGTVKTRARAAIKVLSKLIR